MTTEQREHLQRVVAARNTGLSEDEVMARAMDKIAVRHQAGGFFFCPAGWLRGAHPPSHQAARQMMQQSGISEQDVLRQAFEALRTGKMPTGMPAHSTAPPPPAPAVQSAQPTRFGFSYFGGGSAPPCRLTKPLSGTVWRCPSSTRFACCCAWPVLILSFVPLIKAQCWLGW